MSISSSLHEALSNAFSCINYLQIPDINSSSKFILAKYIDGNYIIPAIYYNLYTRLLTNPTQDFYEKPDIVAIIPQPLRNQIYKTSDSIIKNLFRRNGNFNMSFNCIDTGKGYKYYGGRGLILDEDYRPLMICGYESRVINYIVQSPPKRVCLISPDVYTRNDMVSGCIVRKVIPFYSTCDIETKIIISHLINDFIRVPVPPDANNVDEEIYNILSHNMT